MALDLFRKNLNKKKVDAPSVSMKDIVNTEYPLDPLEILGEKSFNEPQEIDESVVGSPVQEFFRDAVVFITGGTGFMGKILIEKLLRTCPHIKQIYLLIRPKKGKKVEQRLSEIFDDRVNINTNDLSYIIITLLKIISIDVISYFYFFVSLGITKKKHKKLLTKCQVEKLIIYT